MIVPEADPTTSIFERVLDSYTEANSDNRIWLLKGCRCWWEDLQSMPSGMLFDGVHVVRQKTY